MTRQLLLLPVLLVFCLCEDSGAQQRSSKKGVVSAIKKKIKKLTPNRKRQPSRQDPSNMAQEALKDVGSGREATRLQVLKNLVRNRPPGKDRNTAKAKLNSVQEALAQAITGELGNASTENLANRMLQGDGALSRKIQLLRQELAPNQTSETGGNVYASEIIKNAHERVSAVHLQNLYLKAQRNGNALLTAYGRGEIGLREIRAAASRYGQRGAPENLRTLTKVLKNKAERMAEIRGHRERLGNSDQVANHLRQLYTAERLPTRLEGIKLRNRYFKAAAALPQGNLYGDHARAVLTKFQAQPIPGMNINPLTIPTGVSIQLESAKARSRALVALRGQRNPVAVPQSRNHAQLAPAGRLAAGPVRPVIYEQLPAQANPNYDRVPALPIVNGPPVIYSQLP